MTHLTPLARRLVHVVSTLVVTVLLLGTVALLGLRSLGYQTFAITTGSMAGTADPGSLVVAHRVPTAEVAVGDVITYVPPPDSGIDIAITHRIVEIATAEDGVAVYVTKGDANRTVDPWTFRLPDAEQTVMLTAVPRIGEPILWLSAPARRQLVIGVPALAIALLALRDLVHAWRTPRTVPASAPGEASPTAPVEPPVLVIDLPELASTPTTP